MQSQENVWLNVCYSVMDRIAILGIKPLEPRFLNIMAPQWG